MTKKRPTCPKCGSQEVSVVVDMRWDHEKQEFTGSPEESDPYSECGNCGETFSFSKMKWEEA